MPAGEFVERDPAELGPYREEELAEGLTRSDLISSMEDLLIFTRGKGYDWEDDFGALVFATVARSGRTFEGICLLLRDGLAVQAAMLLRSLFEDMVVGHWLYYNRDDSQWLVEKFLRQREAIALHQRKLQCETRASMGPPISMADDAEDRAQALIEEFGSEAQRDWWNPGRKGKGLGSDVRMRKIVGILEDAADRHEMFHPRFAGGAEKLLRRADLVTNKWLSQCLHHTTIGLPFTPTETGEVQKAGDPMLIVAFNATWTFAQQVYLAHDASRKGGKGFEAVFWNFLINFARIFGPDKELEKLEAQLEVILEEFEAETGISIEDSDD